jgi:hypothetical protein
MLLWFLSLRVFVWLFAFLFVCCNYTAHQRACAAYPNWRPEHAGVLAEYDALEERVLQMSSVVPLAPAAVLTALSDLLALCSSAPVVALSQANHTFAEEVKQRRQTSWLTAVLPSGDAASVDPWLAKADLNPLPSLLSQQDPPLMRPRDELHPYVARATKLALVAMTIGGAKERMWTPQARRADKVALPTAATADIHCPTDDDAAPQQNETMPSLAPLKFSDLFCQSTPLSFLPPQCS